MKDLVRDLHRVDLQKLKTCMSGFHSGVTQHYEQGEDSAMSGEGFWMF
jgi:hypothetical protein